MEGDGENKRERMRAIANWAIVGYRIESHHTAALPAVRTRQKHRHPGKGFAGASESP